MEFVQNLPFFCIVAALFFGVFCSVVGRKVAEVCTYILLCFEIVSSVLVFLFVSKT